VEPLARFKWPIILAGIGAVFVFFAGASLMAAFRSSGTSVVAPGETVVTITKPGDYTLWHESKTFLDGKFVTFPDDLPPRTAIEILKQPEAVSVPIRPGGKKSVEWSGTRRVSVGAITFPTPGEYRIVVTGLDEKRAFYLSEDRFLKTFFTVAAFGSAGLLFLIGAVGAGIFILLRKSQS
jgi:hypothetical protein